MSQAPDEPPTSLPESRTAEVDGVSPDASPDVPRFGLAWEWLLTTLLLYVGVAGTALAPFWEWDGFNHESLVSDTPPGDEGMANRSLWLLALGPLISLVVLWGQRSWDVERGKRWWSITPAAGAGFAVWLAAGYVAADYAGFRNGFGGSVFVVSGVALMTAWVLRTIWPPVPGQRVDGDAAVRPMLAAAVTVMLVVVAGVPVATWLFSGRHHTTADALPGPDAAEPADLGRVSK